VNDVWLQDAAGVDTAISLTAELCADPDESVREGAAKLRCRIERGEWPRSSESESSEGQRVLSRLLRGMARRQPGS
jgi:hypothetical protein